MRNLKLTITYDGSRFVGWQRQAKGESIQGLLEVALARLEGGPVTVHGAGRTDAGVHAIGQVANVHVTFTQDTARVARALNAQLPLEVRVIGVEEAAPAFHARFNAHRKVYRYLILNHPIGDPFVSRFVWHVPDRLDREAMAAAAGHLVGAHDFVAFQAARSKVGQTVRTLVQSEIREARVELTDAHGQSLIMYEVTGDGFLRHMVRAIVGTLVDVGRGRRTAESVGALLDGGSRGEAGVTAPSSGLLLLRVDY